MTIKEEEVISLSREAARCRVCPPGDVMLTREGGGASSAPSKTDVLLEEYARVWQRRVETQVRHGTYQNRTWALRRHILPAFGRMRLGEINRGLVKDFVAAKLHEGRQRTTVGALLSTLRICLEDARDDGLLSDNPASFHGRPTGFRLGLSVAERAGLVKALECDQLRRLLAAAVIVCPSRALLFRLLALTGMRLGEALALRWDDLAPDGRSVVVSRGWSHGRLEAPKNGRRRTVDIAAGLGSTLSDTRAVRATSSQNQAPGSAWVFGEPTPHSHNYAERDFKRALAHAALPLGFTPHCLRHSYATHLLIAGESVYYVQRQLGHASISLTADLYGAWLPATNPEVVDRLEARLALPR